MRRLAVVVALVLGSAVLVGCSSSSKSATHATAWSSSCQNVRSRFVEFFRSGGQAANTSRDALNHWTDVWNGATSGRVAPQSAQYQTMMAEMQKDAQASTDQLAAQQRQLLAFTTASSGCDQTKLTPACQAEFKLMTTVAQHEVREAQAIAAAFAAGAKQSQAWNANQRNTAALNAATHEYNAARDQLEALTTEHNSLLNQYNAAQDACSKSLEAS